MQYKENQHDIAGNVEARQNKKDMLRVERERVGESKTKRNMERDRERVRQKGR